MYIYWILDHHSIVSYLLCVKSPFRMFNLDIHVYFKN